MVTSALDSRGNEPEPNEMNPPPMKRIRPGRDSIARDSSAGSKGLPGDRERPGDRTGRDPDEPGRDPLVPDPEPFLSRETGPAVKDDAVPGERRLAQRRDGLGELAFEPDEVPPLDTAAALEPAAVQVARPDHRLGAPVQHLFGMQPR